MTDNGHGPKGRRMGLGMRSSDVTAAVAQRWIEAWTSGDLDTVRRLIAEHVTIEGNLGSPADLPTLLETIRVLAAASVEVPVLSMTTTERRAALLYECKLGQDAGAIRFAEFLDVDDEQISGIRRVFDLTAVDRLLPTLRAPAAS